MAIGERICYLRHVRNMTGKELGVLAGFPEGNADVRIAQYETGARKPKADIAERLAQVLDVSPRALNVPNTDSDIGVMHTLFMLEDLRGLRVGTLDGKVCLMFEDNGFLDALPYMLREWQRMAERLGAGEITRAEYDDWRYNYDLTKTE